MNKIHCIISIASFSLPLVASGCGHAEESNKSALVEKAKSEERPNTRHSEILKRLKAFLEVGDAHVTDETIEFLDGGTFGFAVAYGRDIRYVMFPHPSQWTSKQKTSTNTVVLWNTKPSASDGIDITQEEEFLSCLNSILGQSKVPRSVWRHECAQIALSGKMVWTQGGLLVVPEAAKNFVSKFTRNQANSQPLKNSQKRYGED